MNNLEPIKPEFEKIEFLVKKMNATLLSTFEEISYEEVIAGIVSLLALHLAIGVKGDKKLFENETKRLLSEIIRPENTQFFMELYKDFKGKD